ncbi:MAG: metallophosphoesterase [Butyricicoccaceae bacterium]
MKILALSDIESEYLWNINHPALLNKVDLILSCGDLHPDYLSFIATYSHAPVLYVHGNHDDRYETMPPLGCTCIENKIYNFHGVRILGLGGSMRYTDGIHQYSESEMNWRIRRLLPSLCFHRGIDILLTHSPAFGIGDGTDLPHRGFRGFLKILDRYKPQIMIHGHTHLNYNYKLQRISQYKDSKIINAFERHLFTFDAEFQKL